MLQKIEKQATKEEITESPLSMTLDPNEEINFDDELESEMKAIDKVLASTKIKTKPKMIRKNIEHYFEERALKRRVNDIFDDELLLLD
jgi:hypothetical protein